MNRILSVPPRYPCPRTGARTFTPRAAAGLSPRGADGSMQPWTNDLRRACSSFDTRNPSWRKHGLRLRRRGRVGQPHEGVHQLQRLAVIRVGLQEWAGEVGRFLCLAVGPFEPRELEGNARVRGLPEMAKAERAAALLPLIQALRQRRHRRGARI